MVANSSTTPFLSILIPTWNRVEPVVRAVESVELFCPNVEIVVVDNCSDPEVYEQLCLALRNVPNIKIFRNDSNIGMVRNWNRCIAFSSGEWMGLLCSDDMYAKGAVERAFNLLKTLTQPCLVLQDWSIRGETATLPGGLETAQKVRLPLASGNFWHRDVVKAIGGFDERFEYSPDGEFWFRVARNFPIVKVKEPFAQYNSHGANYMWTTWRQKDFMQQMELLIRVNLKHVFSERNYAEVVDKEVESGLWNTVLTIVDSSFLERGKQDIFMRYALDAFRRASTLQRKRVLLRTLAKKLMSRVGARVFTRLG